MHGLQKFLLVNVLTCLGEIGQGSKIIHGKKARDDSMQYMASLQSTKGHVCGGFLIAEDCVATAAHCDDFNPTHVVLGTHNLKKENEKIKIKETFKHESYKKVEKGDDIMIVQLSTKAQLGHNVHIIKLPSTEISLGENEACQVAGWGLTEADSPSDELKVVDVTVISQQVCRKQWCDIAKECDLPANITCAGGYGTEKGICQGDSGGPLVWEGVAVGIVSFNDNENCSYPNVPNVYMDISKYLQWFKKILTTTCHFK